MQTTHAKEGSGTLTFDCAQHLTQNGSKHLNVGAKTIKLSREEPHDKDLAKISWIEH